MNVDILRNDMFSEYTTRDLKLVLWPESYLLFFFIELVNNTSFFVLKKMQVCGAFSQNICDLPRGIQNLVLNFYITIIGVSGSA